MQSLEHASTADLPGSGSPRLAHIEAPVALAAIAPDTDGAERRLNFVSAIDRNYVVPWSAMIDSYRDHNPTLAAHAFIIHYDLTPDDITYLERVCRSVNVELHFIRIPFYPFALFSTRRRKNLRTRKTMSPIAYAKAFIDRFLPADLKRAVLIDADIIIADDMSELLSLQPEHPLAAVTNIPRKHHHQFNSGFILADLDRWREMRISDIAERFLFAYSDSLHSHDQQTLNLIFGARWSKLPLKWNYVEDYHRLRERSTAYSREEITDARERPVVIHYAIGTDKPWLPKSEHPRASLYRAYAQKLSSLRESLSLNDPADAKATNS
ncbi:MAG: hypothetical protein IT539_04625 [Bradyrhizobiaceae bacterium]|nr:hypothetical protein [Bradyrhizobiaceae bacterium]